MKDKIYSGTKLKSEITISEIVTIHYYEFSKNYKFTGESHNFWELVYVDSGEIFAVAEHRKLRLQTGDIIIHKPNEWHSLLADGINASSAIILSFRSSSSSIYPLCSKVIRTRLNERIILSNIISEAKNAFDSPMSDLVTPRLHRKKLQPFGAEQLIGINIIRLLISLYRDQTSMVESEAKGKFSSGLLENIVQYMSENTNKKLRLDDIALYAKISKTSLKQLFSSQLGCGASEYFSKLKVNAAKKYIRESNYNFTQISELLGYSSVHYFSTQFKKISGMSPTEYATSIEALTAEAEKFVQ